MSYGRFILNTGQSVADSENLLSHYVYTARFSNVGPILDVGAGRCSFARQDLNRIVAMDIEPEIVAHFSSLGVNITCGDVCNIPFPDGHFQGVYCCWVLEHVLSPQVALAEIKRVMKDGGYALVIVPSAKSLLHGFYDDFTHIRPFTKTSLEGLAMSVGFSRYQVQYMFWGRGRRHIQRVLGDSAAFKYLEVSDGLLRRLGVVNRMMLMLEVWR